MAPLQQLQRQQEALLQLQKALEDQKREILESMGEIMLQ